MSEHTNLVMQRHQHTLQEGFMEGFSQVCLQKALRRFPSRCQCHAKGLQKGERVPRRGSHSVGVAQTVFLVNRVFVLCQKGGRNGNSAQRGSFWPDVPADIRPKTSVRPSKCWKKQAVWDGQPARTSMKKLRSQKLRADFRSLKGAFRRKTAKMTNLHSTH